MIRNATDSNFDELIAKGTVLVEFGASWCGPCRMLTPILEQLNRELSGRLEIFKVDVDVAGPLVVRFEVMSIPLLVLYQGGRPIERIHGFQSKEALLDLIRPHL